MTDMRLVNILATWADGKQETCAFPAAERDNDNPLWVDRGDMQHVVPLANVRIWTTGIEGDGSKSEMSDAEFSRRFERWMRLNPQEFERWVARYNRIQGRQSIGR